MGPQAVPTVEHREFMETLDSLTRRRTERPAWTAHELEATSPPAAIGSGRLEWPGASPAQLAFMRAVYDKQAALSRAAGDTFTADLPDRRLDVIYGRHQARKDAAAAARALLAAARSALAAAGLANKVRIGIVSAYRPASLQFVIWQGKGRNGGFPYYYRQMLRRGALRPGDHGPAAVTAMAREMRKWVAAPGYSNHQDGLAIDFGTSAAGKDGLGAIGTRSWFHRWLVANAGRFGFHPYEKEAWHWTYRPGSGSEGEIGQGKAAGAPSRVLRVPRVPLLAGHRGGPPDLILRWNVSTAPKVIDVVVHLHGYWYDGMRLDRDIERVSGLDLAPTGAPGPLRGRPTLTVLPRGHNTGIKQKIRQKDGTYRDGYTAFTFPALVTKEGLTDLVRFALDRFAAQVGGAPPRLGRLILTAHSGGGAALLKILRYHNPHQVHVFDGLYQDAGPLADWARGRIRRDRAALGGLNPASARRYMAAKGGALRVFYQGRLKGGTRPFSLQLVRAISADLGPELAPWYRVEASKYDHFQIPSRYGWRVLADASADVPDASQESPARRELEMSDGATVTFPSGAKLRVVTGPTGKGQEHHDPNATGNPLLDTSATVRATRLSADFTVGELTVSGGRSFDIARIDPALVSCLQKLRDKVGKSVTITSGYRPYLYNEKLYRETYKRQPTKSRHSSGQAADVRIAGMSGMDIAKAAIDAYGKNIGVGIADTYAHVDVRREWARWTYFTDPDKNRRAIAEIDEYRRRQPGGASPARPPADAPPRGAAADFTRKTPAGRRYAALIPLLDRYRGEIPLDFLLGWIDVESNGRIDVVTSINERGFFQIHPAESKDHGFQHERLTIDPDYSVGAGIKLVRVYIDLARKRFPWIPTGSELFWRIVKLQHAMGSGLAKMLLSDMRNNGVPPTSWTAIKAYEPTLPAQRLHKLLRVRPGRFTRNVDAVFLRGRQIAASVGR